MPSHRWGKLNHGQTYGLLADDVARRLATLRLGDYERLLLNHIREHSWARSTRRKDKGGRWPDALPFEDTVAAVACEIASGIVDDPALRYLKKKIYEAARSLVRDRILIEAEGEIGGLLINTDCDEWKTYTREFLPTGAGLAYAIKVQTGSTGETECTSTEVQLVPQKGTPCTSTEVQLVPQKGTRHIEERSRQKISEDEERQEIDRETRTRPIDDRRWETDDAPGRLAAMVVARFGDEENGEFYRSQAGDLSRHYPEDVIERAILDAFGKSRNGRALFAYAATSLPSFLARSIAVANGAASPPPAATARASPSTSVAQRISAANVARAAKTREIFARRKADASD